MPALLTRPASARPPSVPDTVLAAATIECGSVTSSRIGVRRSDACRRKASPCSLLRTPANTWKPFRSRSRAVARPIPDDAPVTRKARGLVELFVVNEHLQFMTENIYRKRAATAVIL